MPGLEWQERSSGSFGFISIAIPDSGSSTGSVALAGACTANHRDGDELHRLTDDQPCHVMSC